MSDDNFANVRVLVVDDDLVFLKLMDGLLSKLSCQVTFRVNGQQALEFLKGNSVNICFMDIMMPVMGGIEAAQIIRDEISKTLPILAITSSNMKATQEKCFDVGMNDFIVKPASLDIIREAIARHVLKKTQ